MVVSKITIDAPASKVWAALTEKAQMKEWYFDIPDFELSVGAEFNFYEPGGAKQFHHRCKIQAIEPCKKFAHTWTHPSHSTGESMVSWQLYESNEKTEITLIHLGIENFADAGPEFAPENYQIGWEGLLAGLKNYLNGLRKHSFEVLIQASSRKVWDILWDDYSYRQWSSVFAEGSCFSGELKQGGSIHFLTSEGHGMYAKIVFCTPYTNMLFQHIGTIKDFKEQPVDEQADKWTGAFENYILKSIGDKTLLKVEIDLSADHVAYFNQRFPQALEVIKKLAE
jgi:uncharacterized protein YndB with AHSA1/START domain